MPANFLDQPHRRFNALTGEWVFVSPHRTRRRGRARRTRAPSNRPSYDPQCYLCPGNTRANQELNPKYESTFVFANDFASFLPETQSADVSRHPLLRAHTQAGTCRVICFSPRHDLTLARMSSPEIRSVVDVWAKQEADWAESGAGCRCLKTKATSWVVRIRIHTGKSGQAILCPMNSPKNLFSNKRGSMRRERRCCWTMPCWKYSRRTCGRAERILAGGGAVVGGLAV